MAKDFFDNIDPETLTSFGDIMIYDNQYVEPLESGLNDQIKRIDQNAADIDQLKQQIPGGETGKGAYLNLGGTPDRYPTVDECVGEGTDGTGFVVMAKPDGLYFYNPVTKVAIPPKKGGGNLAIHGQFPEIFDATHELNHSGRVTRSGVFFSEYDKIGITEWKDPDKACQIMVTSHVDGYEQHVVIGKEGLAYKLFKPGDNNAPWIHYQGTPGGGGGGILPNDLRFIKLLDAPDSYAGQKGKIPFVNDAEDALEFRDPPTGGGGGTGPIDFPETFDELLDTPNDYVGHAGRMVVVNNNENGLTFVDRDPNIAETIHNVYERGQRGVDGKSLKSEYTDVNNANTFAQDCAKGQLIINSDGTRARVFNLAKIVEGNTSTLLNTEVREGRITYLSNPTDMTKRVTPAAGDGFWINGAQVTTSQNMPPHSSMVLFPTLRGGVGSWVILFNRAKEDHRPIVNWTDLDDTPSSYAGNEGKLLSVKMDNSGLEFVDHLIPSNTEEFTQLKDVPPTFIGSANKLVAVNATEDALEFIDSPNHVSEFKDLTDTPTNFSGSGGKMVTVNTTETALEFTDVPVAGMPQPDVEAHVRTEVDILENRMKSKSGFVNFNALGAIGLLDYLDMASSKVSNTPFVINTSGAVRTITLPEIVPHDTNSVSSTQVRAGRVTFFANTGTAVKNLVVHAGQTFYVNNSTVTTSQQVLPKTTAVWVPLIFGSNYQWFYLGVYSHTQAASGADLESGAVAVHNKAITRSCYNISTQLNQDKIASSGLVMGIGAGTARFAMLPEIVAKDTVAVTANQVREGYKFTLYNQSTGVRNIRPHTGQKFWNDWVTSTLDRQVPAKTREDYWAIHVNGEFVWWPHNRADVRDGRAEYVTQDEKDFINGLTTGDQVLNSKSIARPTTMITGTTFTADQAASGQNIICNATTGNITGTAPTIIPMAQATVGSEEVRLGTEFNVFNHSTTGTVTINFVAGSQKYARGTSSGSHTVDSGKFARFVATHLTGSTYGWVLTQTGDTGV